MANLVLSSGNYSVQIINITNPESPVLVIRLADRTEDNNSIFTKLKGARGITAIVIGGKTYALVASVGDSGVQIINITDPSSPIVVAALTDEENGFTELGGAFGITTVSVGTRIYALVASNKDSGVQIIDITDIEASPTAVKALNDGDEGFNTLDGARSITTVVIEGKTYALVASYRDNGIQIFTFFSASSVEANTDGDSIVLTFSEDIAINGAIPGDFTVSGAASNPRVSNIVASGNALTLKLTSSFKSLITRGETISLSYTKTTGSIDGVARIQQLASFTDVSVTNNNHHAPTITGTPQTRVLEDDYYSFVPVGGDADGSSLAYTINKPPSWGNFNTETGEISGTPINLTNSTTITKIVVSLTSGGEEVLLPPFDLEIIEYRAPRPVVIIEEPSHTLMEGTIGTFDLATVFSGADRYVITSAPPFDGSRRVPNFASLNDSIMTFTPKFFDANNSPYIFRVIGNNEEGSGIVNFTLNVTSLPRLRVQSIGVPEGNTVEKIIQHDYSNSETPTGYTLTLADGTVAPDWITVSSNKVVVKPLYSVVESTLINKRFEFIISTTGKTPNAIGRFPVTVINNSETPITYDNGLNTGTVAEDNTAIYNMLSHYRSTINSSLELKSNYSEGNQPNWVSFPNGNIRVIPTNNEVGNHIIPFKITDVLGNELTGTLELTVSNVNDSPTTIDRPKVKLLKNLECELLEDKIEIFDLSTVFYDVDAEDVLTYEFVTDDDPNDRYDGVVRNVRVTKPNFVSIKEGTSELTFTFVAGSENYKGFYNIAIKATDKSDESITNVIALMVGSYSLNSEDPDFIVITACPEITDNSASNTTPESIKLGGFVISAEGKTIKERGIIYSASANNEESLIIEGQEISKKIITNNEGLLFSEEIEGLTAGITYYYRAYAISSDGIVSYGDINNFSLKTLGNKDFKVTDIYISPNPTKNILNITVPEKADYILLNIIGKILKKGALTKGKNSVNVSSLAKGIYLLNLKTAKGNFTKKIVKK